jgi:hypothetical protein
MTTTKIKRVEIIRDGAAVASRAVGKRAAFEGVIAGSFLAVGSRQYVVRDKQGVEWQRERRELTVL